ncbi:putative membrane protein C20F10.07 [Exophiala dermatitidis]
MPEPSPQLKGIKKVLSNRRRSADLQGDETISGLRTNSIDSLSIDKSPTRQSTRSVSQDGSSKSGSSGMRKLLPGHSKRKRRKLREEELKVVADQLARGRAGSELSTTTPPDALSRQSSSLAPDGDTSLLTDDSEVETPPLVSRDSHTGYLTMSSPLVSTVPARNNDEPAQNPSPTRSLGNIPVLLEPGQISGSPSPKGAPPLESESTSNATTLNDRAGGQAPAAEDESMSSYQGMSPARRFRDVFAKGSKSSPTSPERNSTDMASGISGPKSSLGLVTGTSETAESKSQEATPGSWTDQGQLQNHSMPNLDTMIRPLTPPAALISTPVTTVTPPTPTDTRFEERPDPPQPNKAGVNQKDEAGIVVSPSGNMISHRRIRSASSIAHQPSKLSTSMTAPLTPTMEESKGLSGGGTGNRTPSGSIFSSWVSAAQNAATTITNLTGQNRARSGTNASDTSVKPKPVEQSIKEEEEESTKKPPEPEVPRKQLAIETMGSGDLNFEHLGLEPDDRGSATARPDLAELRKDSTLAREKAAAKVEDLLAKRAVSAAYEKPTDAQTPVAEITDPVGNVKTSQTFPGTLSGEKTPPNGSIADSDGTTIKRTNSVRSKLGKRRSRGSSAATGQSAIGAMIGASTAALVNPAKGPRVTGFTLAPKLRNRNFHQQFRSVPEDDYLIEDYSCALQKEILLAGRLYISEGHICFFSNILGWVTTVVISFDEVVSIERENTAVVFQNAIAIQTLHARHTFRSLLYREQTYDLLIGIWRVSHPASFQKSVNGKQLAAEEANVNIEPAAEIVGSGQVSEGSTTEESDSEGDNDSAESLADSSGSHADSEIGDGKTVSRKASGMNAAAVAHTASVLAGTASDVPPGLAFQAGVPEAAKDYPGPATHPPTDTTDIATPYDKALKDEIISAPLGKVYSLLYGPESGLFVRKFLADESKCTEVVLEDDKKGLNDEIKSRQYTYIKPLGVSIGPKSTKCITTETLDFFDLEKAVVVTCSTSTPDVPSGNAFSTKTRYCLSWGPGNSTRFQMSCTIEWTAKSWLKGPIEKGANDGQQQYGDSLVKVLKSAVSGRPRGTTNASKVSKTTKKKRKGEKKTKEEKFKAEEKKADDWGPLEFLRSPLQPAVSILRPVLRMEILVAMLSVMVMILWLRGPTRGTGLGPAGGLSQPERLAAYDVLWAGQQDEFWEWLEARAGVDTVLLRDQSLSGSADSANAAKQKGKRHQPGKRLNSALRDVEAKLREEKMAQREMRDAIKITRERLHVLEDAMEKGKQKEADPS